MDYILEMKNIDKSFNDIRVLNKAHLSIKKGEIHSLIGENAAGKTTLMNILYGMIQADSGEILFDGQKCNISHPEDAIKLGIGMVHQHFKLVPEFSALENIILGYEENYLKHMNSIDYKKAEQDVKALMNKLEINFDLSKKVCNMSIGIQSKVEIIKTLFRGARLIIFDEPTTVLTPNEADNFLEFLKSLKEKGFTMIYISHRLKEIFQISDTITVLRQGRTIASDMIKNMSIQKAATLMIDQKVNDLMIQNIEENSNIGDTVLKLKNVSSENSTDGNICLKDISFTVRSKEILGIAGIEGNGQVELADTIIGMGKCNSGDIFLKEHKINDDTPAERRDKGMHYVPEDRIHKGLALDMNLTENAVLGYEKTGNISKNKFIMKWKSAREHATKIISDFRIKCDDNPEERIGNLSGGNMQKLIIGREIISDPEMLILAQPTVGIDFGSQKYIHEKIVALRDKGASILLISADLDEIVALSDRILVMYRGKIVKEFSSRRSFNKRELGYYMTGAKGYDK